MKKLLLLLVLLLAAPAAAQNTPQVNTELPQATTQGDGIANPEVPGVRGYGWFFNGLTWDRLRGTATDGLLVNLGANNDVTVTGTVNIGNLPTAASTSAIAVRCVNVAGDAFVNCAGSGGGGGVAAAVTLETPNGDSAMDETANAVRFVPVDGSGSAIPLSAAGAGAADGDTTRVVSASDSPDVAALGSTSDAAATVGSTGSINAKLRLITSQLDAIKTAVELIDNDQAGWTAHGVTSQATNNATNVKGSAGRVSSVTLVNTTATLVHFRFYNLAGTPTCSSATGYGFTLTVPASTTGAGVTVPFSNGGIAFPDGIGYCITGGGTSTDNTNAVAGVFGVIAFK